MKHKMKYDVSAKTVGITAIILSLVLANFVEPAAMAAPEESDSQHLLQMIDTPLLFVKRHSYQGIHIYDTYYQWHPGGGIYVLQNPSDPPQKHIIRPVIDPTTKPTLGNGVYSDPELSWDAKKVLFCFKGTPKGNTSIYEIGIDGKGLKQLTKPELCVGACGRENSYHDVGPAYLPDGRIVFTSTRLNGLVPCNNTAVDILHVMNADGSDLHPISVNNVNEFDPSVLADGRILYGRWEYVDKTALTQQTLWTIYPDGSNETAIFANNLVVPEAFLDARPVPGAGHLIASSLTKHNSTPRGSVGYIDTRLSKNDPSAITNLDNPDNPTVDTGDSCEPWPISKDVLVASGRPNGAKRNVIEIKNRKGERITVLSDPDICLHSPILVKPRDIPPVLERQIDPEQNTGAFFVQDIYQGLKGVKRGEVKWLRVIEETSRASASKDVGANPYNQTFLLSAALAFSVKNYLGVVPVEPDGSAYFQVPSGRAIYIQALDENGTMIQSMRTFVQASPGITRSCIGCHEHKYTAAVNTGNKQILKRKPAQLMPESWGSGFVDYPTMVQPILDKHCIECHGAKNGIAAGLDLTGGWTEHFSISYENLVSRRRTQVTADLIAGIDCMNGTARWSAQIFPPRSHGSGAAPLAKLLISGHKGRIKNLSRPERDLIMAWIDTNGLYHGSWDYTDNGCRIAAWAETKTALLNQMNSAGCMNCHNNKGNVLFEHDWINLKDPHLSRILRAPLAKTANGYGLANCRDRKLDPNRRRIRMFYTGGYVHQVLPVENFKPATFTGPDRSGKPVVTFQSTQDKNYIAMLDIIQKGRQNALASPRVDMPGAKINPGLCRMILPVPAPEISPPLNAIPQKDGAVQLTWPRSAQNIGLSFALYRNDKPDFKPANEFLVDSTRLFNYTDIKSPPGKQYYALVASSNGIKSKPFYAMTTVLPPASPDAPTGTRATPAPGSVKLHWNHPNDINIKFNVYRIGEDSKSRTKLTPQPIAQSSWQDKTPENKKYSYVVSAVNRHDMESLPGNTVTAASLPEIRQAIFKANFISSTNAEIYNTGSKPAEIHGSARVSDNTLDLTKGGYLTYPHNDYFDLTQKLSIECRFRLDNVDQMPVIVSCGRWNDKGWFLQKFGDRWRWHVGGVNCDGGKAVASEWVHLVGVFDGRGAHLYENGRRVASVACGPNTTPWLGELFVGQYSGGVGPHYQVKGKIAGVKVYRRALPAKDVEAAFRAGR